MQLLCTSTVACYLLAGSLFTQERVLLGIEAYLASVRLVHQRLPDSRLEYVIIVAHQVRLIAGYFWSWQGPQEQRLQITGSVQCRFRGELIAQIGEALPTRRLQRLLEPEWEQPAEFRAHSL